MKLPRTIPSAPRSAQSAFTMIEIAMSLAIIGFALVAIIGILPMGMDVQKNNRRETIVNQDANYFIDAIRNGARGLDDLTNYVAGITIVSNGVTRYYENLNPIFSGFPLPSGLPAAETLKLNTGEKIIGLLSTPKYTVDAATNQAVNYVVAYVKALSGAATEKSPQRNGIINEAAFSYRMVSEIVPFGWQPDTYYDLSWRNPTNRDVLDNLTRNLHDVRLLFRWPLLPGGKIGTGRQNYRLMVGGAVTKDPIGATDLYYIESGNFTTNK